MRAKKTPLVTLIGRVAVLSIAVSTAAMLLILSVMNGLNRFVSERFWMVDPDLKVELKDGKFFPADPFLEKVREVPGVESASAILQDQALLVYGEQGCMIRLKGVDSAYRHVSSVVEHLSSGDHALDYTSRSASVWMGGGVYARLGFYPNASEFCRLYAVDASRLSGPFVMQTAFSDFVVYPGAIFESIPEYDNQYVICDLGFASQVFREENSLSSIEVKVSEEYTVRSVASEVKKVLGDAFVVKDRIEQQQSMFKSMRAERLIVLAVFAFVMLIATFTMVANQMLLMYEKRKDIVILSSMGMSVSRIRKIFFVYGIGTSVAGCVAGVVLGTLLALGQQSFGWVKLGGGGGNFLTDAYPVDWQVSDLFVVFSIGLVIGIIATILPLRQVGSFLKGNKNE